jgi:hypothetical protein
MAMLRIEKHSDGGANTVRLIGRVQSGHIACIRSAMNDLGARKVLDLSEVMLVDVAVVRFLIRCEEDGVELVRCPLYVREWMLREGAEGAQPGASNAT